MLPYTIRPVPLQYIIDSQIPCVYKYMHDVAHKCAVAAHRKECYTKFTYTVNVRR